MQHVVVAFRTENDRVLVDVHASGTQEGEALPGEEARTAEPPLHICPSEAGNSGDDREDARTLRHLLLENVTIESHVWHDDASHTDSDTWILHELKCEGAEGAGTHLLDATTQRVLSVGQSRWPRLVGQLVPTGHHQFGVLQINPPTDIEDNLQCNTSFDLTDPVQLTATVAEAIRALFRDSDHLAIASVAEQLFPGCDAAVLDLWQALMDPSGVSDIAGVKHDDARAVASAVADALEWEQGLQSIDAISGASLAEIDRAIQEMQTNPRAEPGRPQSAARLQQALGQMDTLVSYRIISRWLTTRLSAHQARGVVVYIHQWAHAGGGGTARELVSVRLVAQALHMLKLEIVTTGHDRHDLASRKLTKSRRTKHSMTGTAKTRTLAATQPDVNTASPLMTGRYQDLEPQQLGTAARLRQDRASGAALHVNRVRTPVSSRRAKLAAMLKQCTPAAANGQGTGTVRHGNIAMVEYKPGFSVRPAWTRLPEDVQDVLSKSMMRSGVHGMEHRQLRDDSDIPEMLQVSARFRHMLTTGTQQLQETGLKHTMSESVTRAARHPFAGTDSERFAEKDPATGMFTSSSPQPRTIATADTRSNCADTDAATQEQQAVESAHTRDEVHRAAMAQRHWHQHAAGGTHVGSVKQGSDLPQHTSGAHLAAGTSEVVDRGRVAATVHSPSAVLQDPNLTFMDEFKRDVDVGLLTEVHAAARRLGSPVVTEPAPAAKRPQSLRPVPAFVAGSRTVSDQAIGNIYDGRYNRSRLLKPAHAAQDIFVPYSEQGESAWLPVSTAQSYSRAPVRVQHERDGAVLRAALGLDGPDSRQWLAVATMDSPMGWKSSLSASYLYDQMS
eukprot:jgi/Ulvmu1/9980/UM059_0029.1